MFKKVVVEDTNHGGRSDSNQDRRCTPIKAETVDGTLTETEPLTNPQQKRKDGDNLKFIPSRYG